MRVSTKTDTEAQGPTEMHNGANISVRRVLMCKPSHFDVEYIINPHMKPYTVDRKKALRQWQGLVSALKSLDITVEVIEQQKGVPDMVFATDQGIVKGNKVLLANFRYNQRKKETPHYRAWFREHGYKIRSLNGAFSFEGGDALFFEDMLFVGTGYRASVSSCEELATKLDIDVFPLRLIDPAFYHLDMCFFPLDNETAFYYPPAFSSNSVHLLKRLVKNLYPLTKEEVEGYAANSFVTENNVVIQTGNPSFKAVLSRLGKEVVEVDVSEFKKAGGGIHCLINVLERN